MQQLPLHLFDITDPFLPPPANPQLATGRRHHRHLPGGADEHSFPCQAGRCGCGCLGVIGQSVNCAVCMLHFTQLRGGRVPKVGKPTQPNHKP